MAEDHQYKFVLRKLTENDSASSIGAETPSDPWSDDQDLHCSTPKSLVEEKKLSEDISFLYSKGAEEPFEDKDLYSDLIKLEEEEKKAKQNREMEFERLKKELEECRASDARNKRRIEELTRENTNILKSISSLYRTAISEMERKDRLLEAANKKYDSFLLHQLQENKCPRCQLNYEKIDDSDYERKSSQSSSYNYKEEYKENAQNINRTHSSYYKKRRNY